ncbi:hypothetical protein NKI02_31395, partial [Mesorhizobium sp. M0730]
SIVIHHSSFDTRGQFFASLGGQFFISPDKCTRLMDPGALRPFVEAFTSRLLSLGHTRLTVSGYEASARHFGHWLQSAKIAVAEINEDTVRRFARHRCRCPGIRRADRLSAKYVNRTRRFVSFLAECEVVTPLTQDEPRAHDDQVLAFQIWLRRHRGISERTIGRHVEWSCGCFRLWVPIQGTTMPVLFGKRSWMKASELRQLTSRQ